MESTGLDLETDGDRRTVNDVRLNSPAQTAGVGFDWEIVWAKLQTERFAKQWFYIPAVGLFWMIFVLQSRRKMEQDGANQRVRKQAGNGLAA